MKTVWILMSIGKEGKWKQKDKYHLEHLNIKPQNESNLLG